MKKAALLLLSLTLILQGLFKSSEPLHQAHCPLTAFKTFHSAVVLGCVALFLPSASLQQLPQHISVLPVWQVALRDFFFLLPERQINHLSVT